MNTRNIPCRILLLAGVLLVSCSAPAVPTATPAIPASTTPTRRAVLIDTDMGPDDWMAVLFLLRRPDVDVRAITVTGTGETRCAAGVRNVLGLIALAGKSDIPVACGRETPLQGNHAFPQAWRDDADRMAGLTLPVSASQPVSQSAPALIATIAQRATSPVSIVALGPLTNLAEAFESKPAWLSQIAGVTVMGGAVDVAGNVGASGVGIDNPHAEWNLYIDPRAANFVLRSSVPVTLVPLDATNRVPITSRFLDELGQHATQPAAKFVTEMLRNNAQFVTSGAYFFWDPLAAAIWADESLATFETRTLTVVESEGPESGRTKMDAAGVLVRVAVRVDAERFERQFIAGLNAR